MVCDFCCHRDRKPEYEFRATPGVRPDGVRDDGRYAACQLCALFIFLGQRDWLLQNSLYCGTQGLTTTLPTRDGLHRSVTATHGWFYENRIPGQWLMVTDTISEPLTNLQMADRLEKVAETIAKSKVLKNP